MIIESYTVTNVGKVRKNNEDNYYVNGNFKADTFKTNESVYDISDAKRNLYAVCDGMGGEEFGENASLFAVSTLKDFQGTEFSSSFSEYINVSNRKICDMILKNKGVRSGTTFSSVYTDKKNAFVCNVGDSRVYLLRDRMLTQLSVDHTRTQQMINMGIITKDMAKTHKDRHVLTQHLGIFPDEMIISPHCVCNIKIQPGDVFLLCSDGLTDMLDDIDIEKILRAKSDVREAGERLVKEALDNGGKDNVTVQVIKCSEKKKSRKLPWILGIGAVAALVAVGVWLFS